MSQRGWHRINIGLLVTIILVNLYTILLPVLPSLRYGWEARHSAGKPTATVQQYVKQTSTDPQATPDEDMSGNRLIIPRMLLNTKIVEGPASNPYGNLKKGAWRLPFTSTPDKEGNTVIAGHRFTYTETRSIFYYLDKLQVGDEIGVQWNGVLHTYAVVSSVVVAPTDTQVQAPTADERLTLYTCTPLWNPKNRLVVVAKPIGENN